MNPQHRIEWVISFILGVASSLFAELIIFFFDANSVITKATRLIIRQQGLRRLRRVQRNTILAADDPRTLVREEWAFALRDLGSKNQEEVTKALRSLFYMADILDSEERDVAHEALRLRYATNQIRSLDKDYLNTMQVLQV